MHVSRFFSFLLLALLTLPSSALANEVYRSLGYGFILELDAGPTAPRNLLIYQSTTSSLLPVLNGFIDDQGDVFVDSGDPSNPAYFARWIEGEQPILALGDGSRIRFEPLAALPEVPITGLTAEPKVTFQVAWELFEQYFSLFPLLQVDWRARYEPFLDQVGEQSDETFFKLLAELIAPVNDGHTLLVAPELGQEFSPGPTPSSSWAVDRAAEAFQVIEATTDSGLLAPVPGVLAGSIGAYGYLAVNQMSDFAADERQDPEVLGAAVDAVLAALADRQGLIIDLRFNPGGSDPVALALAARFADRQRPVFRKAVRIGGYDEYSDFESFSVTPEGVAWGDKPVVVLTSRNTASAAEIGTMALGELPNVTIVGEPTYGIFSNSYAYVLPNGWRLALSPEIYTTVGGLNYEQVGYPPDIPLTWQESALDAGRDNLLERALAVLETGGTRPCSPDDVTLCLQGGRFEVTGTWRDFEGRRGVAHAAPVHDEFGHFWFFGATNIDVALKVLDGRTSNDAFWVYLGALSNVEFEITVRDTQTGRTRVYDNPLGQFGSIGDTAAFPDRS